MPKGPEYSSMSYEDLSQKIESSTDVKELKSISKEAQRRDESPLSHKEIMDTYKGGSEALRGEVALSLFERALESRGIDTLDQSDGRIPENGLSKFPPGKEGQPQVFFKQIETDELSWHEKLLNKIRHKEAEKRVSDEVLVVVRLNNGKTPEDNTVICAIMKQKGGHPDLSETAYMWVMDEKKYKQEMRQQGPEDQDGNKAYTANSRAFRGELTSRQYLEAFKEENGQSYDKYKKERDAKLENDPDHWTSERVKGETLHKLNEQYGELLQKAQERMDAIVKETEEKRKAADERRAKLAKDKVFSSLMRQVERGYNDQTIYESLCQQILASNEGVTQADLDQARKEADEKHQQYLATKKNNNQGGQQGGGGRGGRRNP